MGWEPTPYPQIQMVTQLKEPYDRLWQTAVEFNEKHEKWMNGWTSPFSRKAPL